MDSARSQNSNDRCSAAGVSLYHSWRLARYASYASTFGTLRRGTVLVDRLTCSCRAIAADISS